MNILLFHYDTCLFISSNTLCLKLTLSNIKIACSHFFWGFILFLHLEHIYLCSSFYLIFCFYLYGSGRLVTSDLEEVGLCKKCPMGPSSTLASGHQSYVF